MSINDVRRGSIDDITPEEWNSLNDVAVGVRHDPVNQPSHYRVGEVEAIDYIAQQLGMGVKDYLLGNVHKYLHRHRFKGQAIEDLRKCRWYLDRLLNEEEQGG
jgi:hypothetical protein